jgi:hypothetical protein
MTESKIHPLLIRGKQITDKVWTWTLKAYPHTVAGSRRGFEVRVYHYPAEGRDPYFITTVSKQGWVMQETYSPTASGAESAAQQMLDHLARPKRKLSASDAKRMLDHADRVDRLTLSLLAAIEASCVNVPVAKHALARALGAVIRSNAGNPADIAAGVSVAARAIAGYAEKSPPLATSGGKLRPTRSRLN